MVSGGALMKQESGKTGIRAIVHTWLVHTLLNVTKANVCASMVVGRSFFAMTRGTRMQESRSCGRNAIDSIRRVEVLG